MTEFSDVPVTSSTRRVTDVLFALTESEVGMSVRGIAERSDNSRSSTHRIPRILSDAGFAEQHADGGYAGWPAVAVPVSRSPQHG